MCDWIYVTTIKGMSPRDKDDFDGQLDRMLRADEIARERKRERLEQVRSMQMRSQV